MNILILSLVLAAPNAPRPPQDMLAKQVKSVVKKGPCSPACACGCQKSEPCDCVRGTEKRKVVPSQIRRAPLLFRGRSSNC